MKEQEIQTYEPFWNHWQVSENGLLGEGSFGAVFRIQREEFGFVQYAALKVISIPKSQGETKELEDMGMTRKEIQQYYYGIVQEIYNEIELMAMLKGKSNIVSYEDYEIRERQDGYGYHIFIRMELATALTEYMKDRTMETEEILRMGKDLCRALIECQKHNILHRDIKPANIFVSNDGDFKLGDFGVAKIAKEHQIGASVTGSYSYMAPEMYFGESGDSRVDLYSLALVLYSMSNHRLPFYQTQEKRQLITYAEQQEALQRRMAGEQPSLPEHVPKNLGKVIVKALAFKPEQRFQDAKELYQALCQVEKEIGKSKEPEQAENVSLEQTVALRVSTNRKISSYGEDTVALKNMENRWREAHFYVPEQDGKKEEFSSSLPKTTQKKRKVKKIFLAPIILGIVSIGMIELCGENAKIDGYSPKVELCSESMVASGSSVVSANAVAKQTTNAGIWRECVEETSVPIMTEFPEKPQVPKAGKILKKKEIATDKQVSQTKSKTESRTKSRTESKIESERKSKTQIVESTEKKVTITVKPKTTYVPTAEPVVYAESITIPKNLQLVRGNSVTLPLEISPASAVYSISSSNGSVASVNGRNIQANMAGSCKITVKSGNKTCSCTVTVSER